MTEERETAALLLSVMRASERSSVRRGGEVA